MLKRPINILKTLVFVVAIAACVHPCFGQDFPYVVPEAPEFESPESVGKTPAPAPRASTEQKKPFQSNQGIFKPKFETGAMNPARVPEAPISGNDYYRPPIAPEPPRTGPVRGPTAESRPVPPAASPQRPVASVPQQGSGAGMQPQSDCSQFPMLIARSRSDTEMQMTARQYLTCLIQGGWTMEQARDHVIRTIETTYRPGR